MMKYNQKIVIVLLISITITVGCSNKDNKTEIPMEEEEIEIVEEDVLEEEIIVDNIQEQIKSMTLKEKIGQLIIVGFDGT